MPVTMQDIADKTGLSRPTVSLALRDKGTLSTATRQRVRHAAEALGYRANALARGMRAGKFGSIALVLSEHTGRSYLPPQVLKGIRDALSRRELHLTLAGLPDEKLTDAGFVPRILREYCCDGMLIDYTDDIPERMIDLIESLRQPAIWLNSKRAYDCVYPDDVAIGREATRRLLAAGHRRIAYLDWGAGWKQLPQAHYSQRDRQAGYAEAMRDAGVTPEPIRRQDSSVRASLQQAVAALLRADDAPTAFVTYSWDFARVIAAVTSQQGLSVPSDVSLVNTGSGDQLALDDETQITTVCTPEQQYGAEGVEMLLEKLAAPAGRSYGRPYGRQMPRAVAPLDVVEGQTVAPPPRRANNEATVRPSGRDGNENTTLRSRRQGTDTRPPVAAGPAATSTLGEKGTEWNVARSSQS
ncbi:MAG: LacI family DNA-binding transcriptional regulator [Phycisphaerae bacterium]|nr:LacI family DNA-binding transcriptional regulator [Phycisphaerae bacterium]